MVATKCPSPFDYLRLRVSLKIPLMRDSCLEDFTDRQKTSIIYIAWGHRAHFLPIDVDLN
jgi:hypothetical protein